MSEPLMLIHPSEQTTPEDEAPALRIVPDPPVPEYFTLDDYRPHIGKRFTIGGDHHIIHMHSTADDELYLVPCVITDGGTYTYCWNRNEQGGLDPDEIHLATETD